ncbi:MAG: polysaccharide biosynthesis protein [Clostridia bacterium]|nr:polysaccharide biosynthesis protein [Clostridia bacterium]
MSKKHSIKKNYIYNLIYQITLIIVPVIVTPFSSRALLADGIGKCSFCSSIISYFTIFATFGFNIYAQREIAKFQDDKHQQTKIFWEIFICKIFTTSISLLVFGTLLLIGVFGENSNIMLIFSLNILSVALDISFFFQGNEEFGKIALKNVIVKIVGTLCIFIFVKNPEDLWIYALIHSLMLISNSVLLWTDIKPEIQKINIKELSPTPHLKKSFALFLPTIATSVFLILDKTLIGLITNSDAENGYYEQAEKIVKLCTTIITCLGLVMIPRNTQEITNNNHKQVKLNIYKACNFIWILGIPMTLGLILIADIAIPWFLGSSFLHSALLIKIFAPLILIIGLSNILGLQYMIPYQKDKLYTISFTIGAISNLILNIFLIYFWKSLGATIATIIAEAAATISMLIFLRKDLSAKEIFKTSIKPLIAGAIMFASIYPLTTILSSSITNTLIIVVLAIIIYCICILLLREKFAMSILSNVLQKFKFKRRKHQ